MNIMETYLTNRNILLLAICYFAAETATEKLKLSWDFTVYSSHLSSCYTRTSCGVTAIVNCSKQAGSCATGKCYIVFVAFSDYVKYTNYYTTTAYQYALCSLQPIIEAAQSCRLSASNNVTTFIHADTIVSAQTYRKFPWRVAEVFQET